MNCRAYGVLLAGTCLFLALAQGRAADVPLAQTHDRAVAPRKLFPQITAGIENAQGQLVMNCQIAPDGLTVTDRAWLTFVPRGKGKRWNFNQTPYTEKPLVNFRFDEKFAGLQVSITVEIFDRAKPWDVSETYQEVLQLGGVPRDLPEWFKLPQNRLAYDFDEGTWFPAGWQLPRGKFACWEGAAKYNQQDRHGRHPMLDFGFTQVAENTLSFGGHVPDWEHQCRVFGDAEWLDMGDGSNFRKWHNDGWKQPGRADEDRHSGFREWRPVELVSRNTLTPFGQWWSTSRRHGPIASSAAGASALRMHRYGSSTTWMTKAGPRGACILWLPSSGATSTSGPKRN